MSEQFPTDFAVDLNGKTNAWEAIVLIPFVNEDQVMAEEKRLYDSGVKLTDLDKVRNSCAFEYFAYNYNPQATPKQLKSSLTNFN